jgi:hypothetical protein
VYLEAMNELNFLTSFTGDPTFLLLTPVGVVLVFFYLRRRKKKNLSKIEDIIQGSPQQTDLDQKTKPAVQLKAEPVIEKKQNRKIKDAGDAGNEGRYDSIGIYFL